MAGTYPVPVPCTEVFGNVSTCVVSSGGTTSPAALTNESWTMTTGYTSFPTAQQTTFPYNYFYIRDPADTTNEICMVILGGGGTTTWSVIRGVLGTTPVAHASGATWVQVVANGTLQNFKQTPGASVTSVTIGNNSASEIVVASYTPVSGEVDPGTTYSIIAAGTMGASTTATTIPTLQWSLYSGGSGAVGSTFTATGSTLLAQLITGSTTTTNACPPLAVTTSSTTAAGGQGSLARITPGTAFDVNGTIQWISATSAFANLNFFWTIPGAGSANFTQAYSAVNTQVTKSSLTSTNAMILTCKWGTAATSNVATCPAPLVFRES
jgi:hypothetical protein